MRSIRAKSLFIDFLFTSIPLPPGDDARSLIARRMGYDNQTPGKQAQSDEPVLPVSEAVVFKRDARPGQHLFDIREAEAMLGSGLPVLRIVPFVFHSRFIHCNAFCSYKPSPTRVRAWSLRVKFLQPMLTADLDFALVFSGLCEIIGKLHP